MNSVVIAVLITAPVAFLLGSLYGARKERALVAERLRHLRRIKDGRTAVARPGTTSSAVRSASLDRGSDLTRNTPYSGRRITEK